MQLHRVVKAFSKRQTTVRVCSEWIELGIWRVFLDLVHGAVRLARALPRWRRHRGSATLTEALNAVGNAEQARGQGP